MNIVHEVIDKYKTIVLKNRENKNIALTNVLQLFSKFHPIHVTDDVTPCDRQFRRQSLFLGFTFKQCGIFCY